jgi:hypothetical protein
MMKKLGFFLAVVAGVLSACTAPGGPEQIAVHPNESQIAVYPRLPLGTIIYSAALDMEVSNVERAAQYAKEIAFKEHGYLVSAQSWYQDGEKQMSVVIAVPAYRFDAVLQDLMRLGNLLGEWISSEKVYPQADSTESYSQISIFLHPKESALSQISLPKWRPVRTFEKAWEVSLSLFGFLLDIIIWLVVVIAPFILIAWGALTVYRWFRKAAHKTGPETET